MRKASGRRATSIARVCAVSAFLLFQAGTVLAQAPVARAGSWGTGDGGGVEVKADGSYELVITDVETGANIYSTGRVVDRRAEPDGRQTITLKPRIGGKGDTFVIELTPEGDGELFVLTSGGDRHKAATLRK
jgi:hypothetical protein